MRSWLAESPSEGKTYLLFECPACASPHGVVVKGPKEPVWGWNGSLDAPTLTPSVCCRWGSQLEFVCHFHVTDGTIAYCGDCTHSTRGVHPLPLVE